MVRLEGLDHPIQLLATDLDGTLLSSQNQVSPRALEAINHALEAGLMIVPATGRGSASARKALREIEALPWFITSNGAMIEHAQDPELTTVRTISGQLASSVIDHLRRCSTEYTFAWLSNDGFGAEESFAWLHRDFLNRRRVAPISDVNPDGDDLIKILVGGATRNGRRLLQRIIADLDQIGGADVITVAGSDAAFVELTAAQVNKGTALALLCEHLGIANASTLAIGDQDNDRQMLSWAGYSVAMANATEPIRASSNAITSNNDEDGVAKVIEHLLSKM